MIDFQVFGDEAVGFRLCKMVGPKKDTLVLYETLVYQDRSALELVFRRASLSGKVCPNELKDTDNFWADIMTAKGDSLGEVALDRGSWNSIKNRWGRCRIDRTDAR